MIITIDESDKAHACVNSSHAAHMDRKGHSGLHLTIGKGDMANASKKLELNTISSTETEVVADRERFLKATWFRCFRLTQGDKGKEDVLM